MIFDLEKIGKYLIADTITKLKQEAAAQGHRLTGSLIASIDYTYVATDEAATFQVGWLAYGIYLEYGVSANRIPYTPKKKGDAPRGGTSDYIQGLITYFMQRGLIEKEAIRASFATAAKHKKRWSAQGYGMPTAASYRFSNNGRRTGMVAAVINDNAERLDQQFLEFAEQQLMISLDSLTIAA